MPVYQMLHHVFNHASYHRGQLVTMLNQLGADKIPGTDFLLSAGENEETFKRFKGLKV
ncbi:MAG: hypothetical protein IPP81_11100 [Chitinophagaceae bacterium]|nr:hypothetical protein [Chitinophagaceae bacterium]